MGANRANNSQNFFFQILKSGVHNLSVANPLWLASRRLSTYFPAYSGWSGGALPPTSPLHLWSSRTSYARTGPKGPLTTSLYLTFVLASFTLHQIGSKLIFTPQRLNHASKTKFRRNSPSSGWNETCGGTDGICKLRNKCWEKCSYVHSISYF